MHAREKEVFFLNALKSSLASTHQEGPFEVMFAVAQHTMEQKEQDTREREGQDATKITSAFADSCIQFLWSVMPILIRKSCLCLALMNFQLGVSPPSSSFVTMAVLRPHCVVKLDRWSLDDDRLREDCYYEAVAFSRHSINLKLNEEIMKPEKATEAPRNAGIDSSTMKMKQWYQGQDRVSDKSQWQWPLVRVSDKKAPTGTDRASCQAREPVEDDEEGIAMRQCDMPPPVPERVTNPRIRADQAVQDFQWDSEKMHRATNEEPTQEHGLVIAEASSRSP